MPFVRTLLDTSPLPSQAHSHIHELSSLRPRPQQPQSQTSQSQQPQATSTSPPPAARSQTPSSTAAYPLPPSERPQIPPPILFPLALLSSNILIIWILSLTLIGYSSHHDDTSYYIIDNLSGIIDAHLLQRVVFPLLDTLYIFFVARSFLAVWRGRTEKGADVRVLLAGEACVVGFWVWYTVFVVRGDYGCKGRREGVVCSEVWRWLNVVVIAFQVAQILWHAVFTWGLLDVVRKEWKARRDGEGTVEGGERMEQDVEGAGEQRQEQREEQRRVERQEQREEQGQNQRGEQQAVVQNNL